MFISYSIYKFIDFASALTSVFECASRISKPQKKAYFYYIGESRQCL
jgi:hypothetical protein